MIVVDVNGTTLELLDWLRGADSSLRAAATDTPVIVLTSRSEEVHWVRLLERGAMTCSSNHSPTMSCARIAAVLRRTMPRQPRPILTAGPVRVDLRDRNVTVDERPVKLSAVEYRLLCQLAGEPTRVFTKIDFELPRAQRRQGEQGIQELGMGLMIPFPGVTLPHIPAEWLCLVAGFLSRGFGATGICQC